MCAKSSKIKKIKKIFFLLISLCIISIILPATVITVSAKVDYEESWAKETIAILIERGIISPVDLNGNINPQTPITRAEVAAAINKTYGYTQTAAINYKDADPSAWYYKDLQIAKAAGYMIGDGSNVYPNNPISRQELSTVIGRILKLPQGKDHAKSFKDAGTIADWSVDYVGALAKESVLQGYPDGKFQPKNNITRAEAFTVLLRSEKIFRAVKNNVRDLKSVTVTSNLGDGITVQNYMDVTVTNKGVVLSGVVVNGDLIIAKEVADGSVTLKNVTVRGGTYIYGGGSKSVTVTDSSLNYVVLNSSRNTGIVFNGTVTNSIGRIIALSGGTIDISNAANPNISFAAGTPSNAVLTVKGNVNIIDVKSGSSLVTQGRVNTLNLTTAAGSNAKITVDSNSTITNANFNVPATVIGSGTLNTANINSSGVILNTNVLSAVKKPEVEGAPILDAVFESLTVTEAASSANNNRAQLTAVFDKGINEGLTANDFNVKNAELISISGSGRTYVLTVANITAKSGESVYVTVQKTGYNIKTATRSVNIGGSAVNFTNLAANGSSTSQTTTLTITFDRTVPGLTASDFTVTGATKGTLSGNGPVYYLTLTAISVADRKDVTVRVSKNNFFFTPDSRTVTVYNPSVSFTNLTANGSDTANTTQLTITLSREIPGLTASDFTVTGATRGNLTQLNSTYNSNVYTLDISNITVSDRSYITVKIAKTGYDFSPDSKTVLVRKMPDITFSSLTADGSSTATTTKLTLNFGSDVELTIDNITVEGATKGTLTKETNRRYSLTISYITVGDWGYVKVRVSKSGTNFTPNELEAIVRKPDLITVTPQIWAENGSDTQATTMLRITFNQYITGLKASDFTISGASLGSLSGSGSSYTLGISKISASGTGTITVTLKNIAGYTFTQSSFTVTVYNPVEIAYTYSAYPANSSSTNPTTAITITFSGSTPLPYLTANNISLTGTASVSKGTLTNSGRTYTLPITVTAGGTVELNIPTTSGYSFKRNTSNITVYSSVVTSTVTYSQNGNETVTTTQISVEFSGTVTGLSTADVTVAGTGITVGEKTISGNRITVNITLADTITSAEATVSVNPKSGYTFSPSSKTITVYRAVPVTYTLSYNANGGSGAPAEQPEIPANTETAISLTEPVRTNFIFAGWATKSDATAAEYSPGASISMTGNITLFAVWEPAPIESGEGGGG